MIQSETSETLDSQENAQISATRPQAFIFTNCTIHKEDADPLTLVLGEVLEVAYLHAAIGGCGGHGRPICNQMKHHCDRHLETATAQTSMAPLEALLRA